ncbi:MAG: YiiX family permuted papain-like enzyme [bacterium]|nr:YiiX family permuted papain-like enzyme [bacterium]
MKHCRLSLFSLLLLLSLVVSGSAADSTAVLRDGDIVFHRSLSNLSQAISLVTGSEITHMGLIFIRDGKPWVIEAGGTVRYSTYEEFIARGAEQKFVVKRLASADSILTRAKIDSMRVAADRFVGRNYDGQFNWSDDQLYCSELVWKIYHAVGIDLGTLRKLKEYKFDHPIVKEQLRRRYGDNVPLEEPVIAPSDIFDLPTLTIVTQR